MTEDHWGAMGAAAFGVAGYAMAAQMAKSKKTAEEFESEAVKWKDESMHLQQVVLDTAAALSIAMRKIAELQEEARLADLNFDKLHKAAANDVEVQAKSLREENHSLKSGMKTLREEIEKLKLEKVALEEKAARYEAEASHDCDDPDCQRCHHLAGLRAANARYKETP